MVAVSFPCGCIAGAATEQQFRAGLAAAGFTEIEISPTHQVHEFATAAIIRARKPEEETHGDRAIRLPA
jgi:hypothetical protein